MICPGAWADNPLRTKMRPCIMPYEIFVHFSGKVRLTLPVWYQFFCIRSMGILHCFSAFFTKGNNFNYFLFAPLEDKISFQMGVYSYREEILPR